MLDRALLKIAPYVLMAGTYCSATSYPCREDCNEAARGRLALSDEVMILVVEDDQLIQGMVEEALSDGGFAWPWLRLARKQLLFSRMTNPNTGRS